jgi:hypothetical protein
MEGGQSFVAEKKKITMALKRNFRTARNVEQFTIGLIPCILVP